MDKQTKNMLNIDPVPQAKHVSIRTASNGYIVDVGCMTFVTQSLDQLLTSLREYYDNPIAIAEWFTENKKQCKQEQIALKVDEELDEPF